MPFFGEVNQTLAESAVLPARLQPMKGINRANATIWIFAIGD